MSRRSLLGFVAVAAILLAAAGVAGAVFIGDGRPDPPPQLRALDLASCRDLEGEEARGCFAQRFLSVLDGRDDPRPGVQAISDLAWDEGGFLLTNCHVIMHTVGRRYARDGDVTLANLMEHLPLSNDPGCSAGFAHGLVTGVAPDLDPSHPAESASVCADADTRWQRYSCVHGFGHAFMRLYADQLKPALELCVELGADTAPDCAQGAYHDYWLAVIGADDTTLQGPARDRSAAALRRPAGGVRAAVLVPRVPRDAPRRVPDRGAAGHRGPLRGPRRRPARGLRRRRGGDRAARPGRAARHLRGAGRTADAASCVRGTKVQNLLKQPAGRVRAADRGLRGLRPGGRGPRATAGWARCSRS